MLDPKTLSERRDEISESCRRRSVKANVNAACSAADAVRALKGRLDDANRARNSHQTAGKGKLSPEERETHTNKGRELKADGEIVEKALATAEEALYEAACTLPNFLHPSVPDGGEHDSDVIREVGTPTKFDFTPLDHVELGEKLELIDFENASHVTGTKFYYLKNEAVLLDLALQRMAFEMLRAEGFTLHTTPDLARASVLEGIGFNPRGKETQVYSIENTDLCLVGTAEITLGGLNQNSIIEEEDLPLKLAGLSHCFRTEAGAAGRESRGLYRVHQFTKVEMFVICKPEDSEAIHEELLTFEERFFQALEVPYRVLNIAAGDLGAPAYRKFDIEAWIPTRGEGGAYGEVTSASNCTDYQARRLGTRIRRKPEAGQKKGKVEFPHMLNGTAVAVSRALIAILENHQRADGSIAIPKALQAYTGFDEIKAR
jgi:seryl-tRNA synthetase